MAAINLSGIKTSIYNWVYAVTSLRVVWADENCPQPNINQGKLTGETYVILRINGIVKVGHDYMGYPAQNLSTKIIGNREFTLNIQVKGYNAVSITEDIRSSIDKPSVLSIFDTIGIAVVDDSNGVTNLTELDDTLFIERGSTDIIFRTNSEITDNVYVIETVQINETYKNVDGSTAIAGNFTIDTTP